MDDVPDLPRQRSAAPARQPAHLHRGETVRLCVGRHIGGAGEHEQLPPQEVLGGGSGQFPTLHAGLQPRVRRRQLHRRQPYAGEDGRALPRHRQDGQPGLLHREPVEQEPAHRDERRGEKRADHHPPRGGRRGDREEIRIARENPGVYQDAPREEQDEILLLYDEEQIPGQGDRRIQVHLPRTVADLEGDGHPSHVRLRGGGLQKPAGIHGQEHQRPCREDHLRPNPGGHLRRDPYHLQGDQRDQGGPQGEAQDHLPHPHHLSGAEEEGGRNTLKRLKQPHNMSKKEVEKFFTSTKKARRQPGLLS